MPVCKDTIFIIYILFSQIKKTARIRKKLTINLSCVKIRVMKKTKLNTYIYEILEITIKESAAQIGCAKEYLCEICNGRPAGRVMGLRIEKWSKGAVKLSDVCYPISATKIDEKK